jgi:methionine sulfoxide reductase heme-binding subunit
VQQSLWFASRATGLVTITLLTLTMVLGILGAGRYVGDRWPRFTLAALHRNTSLMMVLFLVVHVSTSIIDPYAGIKWLDAVVPFVSVYKTFWLGLGAVALDLMVAILLTTALRTRISHRLWRGVHWLGYAAWPVGLVHGWGTGGKDSHLTWVQTLDVLCVVVVVVAVVWRVRTSGHPDSEVRRAVAAESRN